MFETERKPVTIRESSSRRSSNGEDCEITIRGINEAELHKIEGMLAGTRWCRVKNGRLQSTGRYKKPPGPVADPVIDPFWPTNPGPTQMVLQNISELSQHGFTASITIQHLCGYGYTVEKYKFEARKLRSFGFVCLRSRRGRDGRYWEIWFLPYLDAAKGSFKEAITGNGKSKFTRRLSRAVRFLARNSSFGTCDVSVQRLAMTID